MDRKVSFAASSTSSEKDADEDEYTTVRSFEDEEAEVTVTTLQEVEVEVEMRKEKILRRRKKKKRWRNAALFISSLLVKGKREKRGEGNSRNESENTSESMAWSSNSEGKIEENGCSLLVSDGQSREEERSFGKSVMDYIKQRMDASARSASGGTEKGKVEHLRQYMRNFLTLSKVDFESENNSDSRKFKLADKYRMELDAIGSASFVKRRRKESTEILIHPQSYFKQYWNTLVTVAVLFACFQAPIRATFTPMGDLIHPGNMDGLEIFDLTALLLVEVIFVLDIFVSCFVGYKKLGVVVLNKKLIRSNYFKTTFAYDLLAALPILFYPVAVYIKTSACAGTDDGLNCMPNWIYMTSFYITLLQLLKIPSGIERSIFLRDSLSDSYGTTLCDMIMLVFLFVVLANFFTCLWFLTMAYNPNTNGFKDWNEYGTGNSWLTEQADSGDQAVRAALECWLNANDLCDLKDKWVLYINCFYWASNAGDGFDTVQTMEKVTAIVVTIIFNNGFFAFILASIIAGLQDFNRKWKKRAEYRIKIDAVNEFMRQNNVSEVLKNEVRDFFFRVWLPRKIDFTEDSLMREMPDYIRKKVMRDITIDVILGSKFYEKYFDGFR